MSVALSHLGPATNARLACPSRHYVDHTAWTPGQGGAARSGEARRAWHCFDLGHQRPGNAISSEEHLSKPSPAEHRPRPLPLSQAPPGRRRLAKGPGQQTGRPPPSPSNSTATLNRLILPAWRLPAAPPPLLPPPPPCPHNGYPLTFIVPDICMRTGTSCSGLHLLLLIPHLELHHHSNSHMPPPPHPLHLLPRLPPESGLVGFLVLGTGWCILR